jgi:hypothetical protein
MDETTETGHQKAKAEAMYQDHIVQLLPAFTSRKPADPFSSSPSITKATLQGREPPGPAAPGRPSPSSSFTAYTNARMGPCAMCNKHLMRDERHLSNRLGSDAQHRWLCKWR